MDIFVQIEIISRWKCHRAYSIVLMTGNESDLDALQSNAEAIRYAFDGKGINRIGSDRINRIPGSLRLLLLFERVRSTEARYLPKCGGKCSFSFHGPSGKFRFSRPLAALA